MLLMAEPEYPRTQTGITVRVITPRCLVNIAQAVTIARVHRNTIYNWIKTNKVDWVRTAGGDYRIYADTLLRRNPED